MKIFDFLHSTKTQAYLAYIVVIGFPLLISLGKLSEGLSNRLLDIVLLSATFYWGSSKSGATKDETIASLANQPQAIVTDSNIDTINTDVAK